MANTIRLTMTDQLQEGLKALERRFPFMRPDEILKMALSRLYKDEVVDTKVEAAKRYNEMQTKLLNAPGGICFKDEQAMTDWWTAMKDELRKKG